MHIYPKNASYDEVIGINMSISFARIYLLDLYNNKLSDYYFMNKDIILSFSFLENIGLTQLEIKKTLNYKNILKLYEKTRSKILF
jgi:hypothetical protein